MGIGLSARSGILGPDRRGDKTELLHLAELPMFNDEKSLIRVDMSNIWKDTPMSKIISSP